VVTLGAEIANPWGAVCGESRMHVFDAGVGKRLVRAPRPAQATKSSPLELSMSEDTLHHVIRRNVHDSARPRRKECPMKFKGDSLSGATTGTYDTRLPPAYGQHFS